MALEPDDAAQLAAWRAGDNAAGSELVRRRMPEMIRFFRNKVAVEADIADLVNQTFLACVKGKDDFRGETSIRRYLYAIANNVLLLYIRGRGKRGREEVDFATVCISDVSGRSASSILTDRRETLALVTALREIPLEDQIVLELMYFEGLRGPEIAELLGLPEGTVRGRIRRGLDRLRARVELVLARGEASPPTEDEMRQWADEIRRQVAGPGDA